MMYEGNNTATTESMDLVVSRFNPGELVTNAQALLEIVKTKLQGYNIENYSEDNIDQAKKDKAELNAAADKLNKKRIELEAEFNKPFLPFKTTIAEVCKEIKNASMAIDILVKEVENREKKKKETEIYEFFEAQNCNLFSLGKIFNPQWLNKTYKMKDIEAEIIAKITKTKNDLAVLEKCNEPDATAFYLETLDLNSALAEANKLKEIRERLDVINKEKEEQAVTPGAITTPKPEPHPEAIEVIQPKHEPFLTVTLKLTGTATQLKGLRVYIDANKIKYEKVGEE